MSSFVLSLCLIVSVLCMPLQKAISTELLEVFQNETRKNGWGFLDDAVKWVAKPAEKIVHPIVKETTKAAVIVVSHTNHAANTVVKETVKVHNKVGEVAVDFGNNIENEFKKVRDAAAKELKKVKQFVDSLNCKISPDELLNVARSLGGMSHNLFSTLKNIHNYKGLKSTWSAMADSTCRAVWDHIGNSLPVMNLMITFLSTLHRSCKALEGGGNPAISLGVGIAGGLDALYSAEVSAEMGLAVDRKGGKYCYVGGCYSVGVTLPPIPSMGTQTGVHMSVWTDPSQIEGSSNALGISGEMGMFGGKVNGGLDYIYGKGELTNFIGFSISGSVGAITEPVTASIGFSAATCLTPVYLKYKPAPFRWFVSLKSNASLLSLTSNDTNDGTNYDTTEPCAHEGETCICNGDVYYGINEDYIDRAVDDHIDCSAEMFQMEGQPEVQSDPEKICVCVGADYDLGRRCADEGDTCECTGGVTYGARGFYDSTIVDGSIVCSSDNFGDPVPGIAKHCYCNE